MSLVRDASLFTERVSRAPISGNIDNPEGGLDALMQVMVCGQKIGWREGARRVIIYTSDQVRSLPSPHLTPHLTAHSSLNIKTDFVPETLLLLPTHCQHSGRPGCK